MDESSSTDQMGPQGLPAPTLPSRSFGEVRGFNGLRGVAVLIVFVAHMDVILPIPTLLVIPGATVSLDSFFVLSGFLISGLLFREYQRYGSINYRNFLIRRAFKIYPSFYLFIN